jgi:uncharacterized protein
MARCGIRDQGRPADKWLVRYRALDLEREALRCTSMDLELMGKLRERAEEEAIRVFART